MNDLKRREFLKASAAFAGGRPPPAASAASRSQAPSRSKFPTIDKLTMRVLIDQAHDQFLRGSTVNGVVHEGPGPGRSADARNVLHNQWGLSLFLESQRGPGAAHDPARLRLHGAGAHQQYRTAARSIRARSRR